MPDLTPRAITVPRPHVAHGPAHLTAEEADVSYLRAAAGNIQHARCLGSNLTNTVTQLLFDAANAIEAAGEAGRARRAALLAEAEARNVKPHRYVSGVGHMTAPEDVLDCCPFGPGHPIHLPADEVTR
jgi:hypothetical protein